jgi:F-type H+-transporting ATPase subunit delta
MAELATVARPYAEALFDAYSDQADAVLSWLEPLAAAAADPVTLAAAQSPAIQTTAVVEAFASPLGGTLDVRAKNFLGAVVENGRLAALPEVLRQFRALLNDRSGSRDAVVWSAFELDEAALAELQPALEKRFKARLNLSMQIDSKLIGGVRVVVGDEVYDASVKSKLEQMRVALSV